MKVLGITGWSGSGKTTLLIRLIPLLKARGLSVSTMKHVHHAVEFDRPGKDSFEHRKAGANEVMLSSARRWALMSDLPPETEEPPIDDLLGKLSPVDLVLVEGWKHGTHSKLEVHRPANGKPLLAPDDPRIIAVASDTPLDGLAVPRLDLNDVDAIADFIETWRAEA